MLKLTLVFEQLFLATFRSSAMLFKSFFSINSITFSVWYSPFGQLDDLLEIDPQFAKYRTFRPVDGAGIGSGVRGDFHLVVDH